MGWSFTLICWQRYITEKKHNFSTRGRQQVLYKKPAPIDRDQVEIPALTPPVNGGSHMTMIINHIIQPCQTKIHGDESHD